MSTVRSLPLASSSQVLSKWVPKLLTICLLSILGLLPLHGQTLAGINGTVTDSSGAVVPDAAVSATNNATGVAKQTHTGTTGTYILTDLIPGIYTVKVEKPSFKTSVNNAVTVEAGTKASFNAVLQAGTVSESVEVTTSAISLQTEQPQLGTTIENKQV